MNKSLLIGVAVTMLAPTHAMALTHKTHSSLVYSEGLSRVKEKIEIADKSDLKRIGIQLPGVQLPVSPAKATDTYYNVKFNNTGTSDGLYAPVAVTALSQDGREYECELNEELAVNELALELPEGTYDFIGVFVNVDESLAGLTAPAYALVVKENEVVSADAEISMSADEAVNKITFRQELPDGSALLLPEITSFNDAGEPVWNHDETSYNVLKLYVTDILARKDGATVDFSLEPSYRLWNGESAESACDILLSNVSDRWVVCQTREPMGASVSFSLFAESSVAQSNDVKVNAEDFYLYNLPYKHSSGCKNGKIKADYRQGVVPLYLIDGAIPNVGYVISSKSCGEDEYPSRYVAVPDGEVLAPYLTYFVIDGKVDVYGNEMDCSILGAPLSSADGKLQCVVAGGEIMSLDGAVTNAFYLSNSDFSVNPLAPGHTLFSYTPDEVGTNVYGNSVPILSMTSADYCALMGVPNYRWNLPTFFSYMGRLGENRVSDWIIADFDVELDGASGLKDFNLQYMTMGIMNMFQADPALVGDWKWRIENTNIDVSGVEGSNITEIYFSNANEESDAPTMRFLQLRDKDGNITDRFATAGDGIINFAAADYKVSMDPVYGNPGVEPKPVTVKVEYAPYKSSDFVEIDVEELPEQFMNGGLGYIYTATTGSVDRKSDNGWFDLRFTVTDLAGNSQVQTLSPAFRIDDLSGVEDIIYNGDDEIRVEGRNIIMPADGIVFDSTGTIVGNRDLAAGVYFVKTPRTVRKVLVK